MGPIGFKSKFSKLTTAEQLKNVNEIKVNYEWLYQAFAQIPKLLYYLLQIDIGLTRLFDPTSVFQVMSTAL